MSNSSASVSNPKKRRGLTLTEYIVRRNGVPLGHADSLKNMLSRSLGASSFAKFWQYWNPLFGYCLGKYIFAPLKRLIPTSLALIITFGVSGGIHDIVTMLVRRSPAFLFTPWFIFLGIGVITGERTNMDTSNQPWWIRATINLIYLTVCLFITVRLKQALMIP